MFVAIDNNDLAVLIESLHKLEAFLMNNQEQQEESFVEALELSEDYRFESEVNEQE